MAAEPTLRASQCGAEEGVLIAVCGAGKAGESFAQTKGKPDGRAKPSLQKFRFGYIYKGHKSRFSQETESSNTL
jgi:hypothetical protein